MGSPQQFEILRPDLQTSTLTFGNVTEISSPARHTRSSQQSDDRHTSTDFPRENLLRLVFSKLCGSRQGSTTTRRARPTFDDEALTAVSGAAMATPNSALSHHELYRVTDGGSNRQTETSFPGGEVPEDESMRLENDARASMESCQSTRNPPEPPVDEKTALGRFDFGFGANPTQSGGAVAPESECPSDPNAPVTRRLSKRRSLEPRLASLEEKAELN